MATKISTLKKPALSQVAMLGFVEGSQRGQKAAVAKGRSQSDAAPVGQKSGLIPEGDVRLTANIRGDLHMKLKMRAVQERTTVGELIEDWIAGWKQ